MEEQLVSNLESCLFMSEDSEEFKGKYVRASNPLYNLASLQKHFKTPDKIQFIGNNYEKLPKLNTFYVLFIENEFDNILLLLEKSNKSEVIKNIVVCTDVDSAQHFIESAEISPILIGLDFHLVDEQDWHKYTYQIINEIKRKRWGEVPLLGITQFESKRDKETKKLVDFVRGKKNSVLDKQQNWEALPNILKDKFEIGRLTKENQEIKKELENVTDVLHKKAFGEELLKTPLTPEFLQLDKKLIGSSSKIVEIKMHIQQYARDDSNLIILGETGTGKQNVAEAIHKLSCRNSFIDINCAALPETLIDSELFGHEKGAFTGALAEKQGKLEIAKGGTVFLDEIHHLNIASQGKLLKVLEKKEFYRVGGTNVISLENVRIIAAAKPNIEELIEKKLFLEDLYSRLESFMPIIPPLRERIEDIPELVDFFLDELEPRLIPTDEAIELLKEQPWRRNVRELRNFIQNLHRLCSLKRDIILDKNKVEYGLALHNKQSPEESLVKKIFSKEIEEIDTATRKIEEPKAKIFFSEFLNAMEKCEGSAEIGLDEICKAFTNPKTKKPGIAYTTLSSSFNKYAKYFRAFMNEPEFSVKLSIAIRYNKLRDILKP